MLQTLIGVGILAAAILLANEIFKRSKSTGTNVSGGGSPIDEGTGTGDGSVTPPGSGTNAS